MTVRIFNRGFNFRQDGPGNRLIYHLHGCNLHCPWCSNPEGMSANGGEEVEVNEIVAECLRSRKMFFDGGGVTFTGGEATEQSVALVETLQRLRENGIGTALETNGTSPHLMEISPLVDCLMLDFKHVDSARFSETCGNGFDALERNYSRLVDARDELHVRIPLINGFNADDASGFADYFASRPHDGVDFEFLPYHEYGRNKWKAPYAVENGFVSSEQVARFVSCFTQNGLKVVST